MIASSTATNRQTKPKRSGTDQPEKCKHCGKYVIHTDGICDVYNVPAVHMASTGLSDTQSYSVIFQDTSFDDHEYMFMTTLGNTTDLTMDNLMPKPPDLGIIDDLTTETFLRRVPRSVLESSAYELSDA